MTGQLGFGIQIRVGATAAAATATVLLGNCTEIPFPPVTRESIDVTSHDSPGGVREYIPGLKDTGELSITMQFIPGDATHDHIRLMQDVAMNVQADFLFEITYAQMSGTPPRCSFRAFVTGFEGDGPFDAPLTGTLMLRPTTAPIWANV